MLNKAKKATRLARIDAWCNGLNKIRSIATPPMNDRITTATKATQYGVPQWISCQATKVENVAISPCAKLRWSIARKIMTTASAMPA